MSVLMIQLHYRRASTEPATEGDRVMIALDDIVLIQPGYEANRAREIYQIGTDIRLRHLGSTPLQVFEEYDAVVETLQAASAGMFVDQWRLEQMAAQAREHQMRTELERFARQAGHAAD